MPLKRRVVLRWYIQLKSLPRSSSSAPPICFSKPIILSLGWPIHFLKSYLEAIKKRSRSLFWEANTATFSSFHCIFPCNSQKLFHFFYHHLSTTTTNSIWNWRNENVAKKTAYSLMCSALDPNPKRKKTLD